MYVTNKGLAINAITQMCDQLCVIRGSIQSDAQMCGAQTISWCNNAHSVHGQEALEQVQKLTSEFSVVHLALVPPVLQGGTLISAAAPHPCLPMQSFPYCAQST